MIKREVKMSKGHNPSYDTVAGREAKQLATARARLVESENAVARQRALLDGIRRDDLRTNEAEASMARLAAEVVTRSDAIATLLERGTSHDATITTGGPTSSKARAPKPITIEMLRAMTPEQRTTLHHNASARDTPAARAILDLLTQEDLMGHAKAPSVARAAAPKQAAAPKPIKAVHGRRV